MNCYYHSDRTGQGQCLGCGKILCANCMDVSGKMRMCSECAVDTHRTYQRQVYSTLALSVVFAVVGAILFRNEPNGSQPLLGAYTGFSIFWGRRFLRDIFYGAVSGLWVSWSGFLWIKIFQLFFYMFVGFFTAPIAVALAVYRLNQSHKTVVRLKQAQTSALVG